MSYAIKIAIIFFLIALNLVIYTKLLISFKIVDFSQVWSFNFENAKLSSLVKKNIGDKDGNFAVYIRSLADEREGYEFNAREIFPAGSLYKLFLLAQALEEIEKGSLKEDQVISASLTHLEEVLGSEDFGYDSVEGDKISYSVLETLNRIATVSDNYASIALAEKIGWDKIQNQAKKLGAKSTTIKSPISTTASDIGLFFRKLYGGEVVSRQSSDKIIDLLSKSKLNSRIPAQLPKDIKIAHKTAELPRIRHDAGIVYLADNPYIIVLMSKDLKFEDDGVETLANISKDVYEYFKETK